MAYIQSLYFRYKSAMQGVNAADEKDTPEEAKYLTLPNLLIVSTKDYATRADVQEQLARQWVKDLKVETLDCGHWVQLEKPNEYFELVRRFADEVAGK